MIDGLELPAAVAARDGDVTLRRAETDDLAQVLRLLGDDEVSAARGDFDQPPDPSQIERAFHAIAEDPSNELVVVVDASDAVVGTMQLTRIPGLARQGATRLLVEAVRVDSDRRSAGIGGAMMRWVQEAAAVQVGAALVQLTSDARRPDAHRFYRDLGFIDSHVGFTWRPPTHT